MAKSTYTVQRSTTIAAPAQRIYDHIIDFHQWPQWSPWEDIDPDMQRTYSGADSGPGAAYSWSGDRKAGAGRMQITSATEPTKVDIDLHFDKPFKADNVIVFDIAPGDGGQLVTWTLTGTLTPLTKIFSIFKSMDSLVGSDFERGLSRLRAAAESPAAG
jgi:Polyketide cyclase / dehydrase and lipid transport